MTATLLKGLTSMFHVRGQWYQWLRISAVFLVLSMISFVGDAMAQDNCEEVKNMARNSPNSDKPIVVSMMDLRNNAADYFGKTVTVDGELHRTFTNNAFTIEGGDWAN